MNLSGKGNSEFNFVNFNQDFSCLSVGTKQGFKIYNCEPFGRLFQKTDGGISIIEMLYCTSLVALVGGGDQPNLSPRKMQIINTKKPYVICELTFPTTILAVKMNRKRLVVVLDDQIYIYDISNMKLLHTVDTLANPGAICTLSPHADNCFLAYPAAPALSSHSSHVSPQASNPDGTVLILDALTLKPVNVIDAHKSPVSCLAFNNDGTMLATSSDKGTVIRVFSVPEGTKLFQFRRGSSYAKIYSMNFSIASTLLCVSSDTETVHIFRLIALGNGTEARYSSSVGKRSTSPPESLSRNEQDEKRINPGSSNMSGMRGMVRKASQGIGKGLAAQMNTYLPSGVKEIWEPQRDFAFIKLPNSGVKSIVAMSGLEPRIMVVTSEGFFYQYNVDLEFGGECVLVKQFSLLDQSDEMAHSSMVNSRSFMEESVGISESY
ncbi:Autophagy-related protein 18 [Neolecta irregularis DAH-3]|uniref:Autophagy-related protein 18 n=1 Tax=Neolecta irregularis (strain DAH-3) TaxID=1198029 RepID=A0A1U7LL09_NEOID|nr:Autophagy-related protein 18 [Neolecta irregularis DAH-3]|eukprot:OLL23345.1 Autophagy-related protein 18 [Neolecta irregularis DAH-3]